MMTDMLPTISTALQLSVREALGLVPVPAGAVTLGMDDKTTERYLNSYGAGWQEFFGRETPQHQIQLDAFELMRYPVTNGLYNQFMAAGGYENPDYWTPDGWSWRLRTGRTHPLHWNEPRFAGDAKPVVGVSWFEAIALASWLSRDSGLNVRLPSEAEWEWAARGTNTRSLYPWGGAWDATKLNSGYSDNNNVPRKTTAPVGSYSPQGDGPFGHGDLLGQVWEWTNSLFKPYPYNAADGREDRYAPDRRVLRGGNWADGKYTNRVTTRYLFPPHYSEMTTGFRLAVGGSAPAIRPRSQHDLVVFGRTNFCPDLAKLKDWLAAWNVSYRQLNVDLDETAALRLDNWLGSRTIPTLVVAERNAIDPVAEPAPADFSQLRNADRGPMLHEPEEQTLRTWLTRNGFLRE